MAAMPEDDEFYGELARPPGAKGRIVRSSADIKRIAELEEQVERLRYALKRIEDVSDPDTYVEKIAKAALAVS